MKRGLISMIRKINRSGFDKFGTLVDYARFLRVMDSHQVKRFLLKEVKVRTLSKNELYDFDELMRQDDILEYLPKIDFGKFPMSLSIIGKCLKKNQNASTIELVKMMAEYNTESLWRNYAYLKQLSKLNPQGLYINISGSEYVTLKGIIIYKCD